MEEVKPVPNVKTKLDELFLHWLAKKQTQDFLKTELKRVILKADLSHATSEEPSSSPNIEETRHSTPSPPPIAQSPKSSKKNRKSPLALKSIKRQVENEGNIVNAAVHDSSSKPRRLISGSSKDIPQFYFPHGKPEAAETKERLLKDAQKKFKSFPKGEVPKSEFGALVKACGLPLYWKVPLFKACCGDAEKITYSQFKKTWNRICHHHHDEESKFVCILTGPTSGRNYLVEDDFVGLVQDVLETHPGLAFLSTAPEFHARYVETVIARIFYSVSRNWRGQISLNELRKSKLLQVIRELECEPDINLETNFFSYQHFYVLYCKFWELDTDHDLILDMGDLSSYADQSLPLSIVSRLMSGVVTSKESAKDGVMTYKEFIWFLLAEEDKTTPRSIEYWFRCLDTDGDGKLSLYELETFYLEVLKKMIDSGIEGLPTEDSICQVLDMVNPSQPNVITLTDLKSCKMAPVFLNTFINIEKYLEYEQREPTSNSSSSEEPQPTDWEKYASEQYELLVAEEEQDQSSDDSLEPELASLT